jgi:Uma2 family endonuclease
MLTHKVQQQVLAMNSPSFLRVDKATFYKFISGPHEGRYEYEKGFIVQQMAGGTFAHHKLGARAVRVLGRALDASGFDVLFEYGVETADTVRYPDVVALEAGTTPTSQATNEPVLIIEVVSPSSVNLDLQTKPAEYMGLPSLHAYIALSQHDVAALAWVRGSDRLFPAPPTEYGVGGIIDVPALSLALALDDIYAGIELSPPETPHG